MDYSNRFGRCIIGSKTNQKASTIMDSELEFDAEYFVDDLTDEEIIELVEMNEWEPDFADEDEDF
jgi:hypothetical protein